MEKRNRQVILTIVSVVVVFICFSLIFSERLVLCCIASCKEWTKPPYYIAAEWKTEYNEYEHYLNIIERTEKFVKSKGELKDIYSYEANILYSFYDYPEYFSVDFTCGTYSYYYEQLQNEKNYYLYGYIENDEYYVIGFYEGQSAYKEAGVLDYRLYYGGIYAYEKDHNIIELHKDAQGKFYHSKKLVESSLFKSQMTADGVRKHQRNCKKY